ncbi:hypothetical protein [Nesterenkonia suensis]
MRDVEAEAEMLLRCLQGLREAMVWKLDGVTEHRRRRRRPGPGRACPGALVG